MCVLCGYIGDRPAAPALLEMLEREEGFLGGYYTGLATVHEGMLHHEKVVGDVAALRSSTSATELPGTIGIAHSRTPSGGDREWGHPFVDCESRLAYVANGSMGVFEDTTELVGALTDLVEKGHNLRSLCREEIKSYPMMPDGRSAHISDMMCHAIEEALAESGDPVAAIREGFERLKAEIVGLALSADFPDRIVAARRNQPLWMGRDNGAVYLASTAIAFPDTARWRSIVPPNSVISVTLETVGVHQLSPPDETPSDQVSRAGLEQSILDQLAGTPGLTMQALMRGMGHLWPPPPARAAEMTYEVLERLLVSGKVRYEAARVEGMFGQGTVPQFRLFRTES